VQSRRQSCEVESLIVRDHRDGVPTVEIHLPERLLRRRLDRGHLQLPGQSRKRLSWLDHRQPNPELCGEAREREREWRRADYDQLMRTQHWLEKHLQLRPEDGDTRSTLLGQRLLRRRDDDRVPPGVAEATDRVAPDRDQHPPAEIRIGQRGREHCLLIGFHGILQPPPDRIRWVVGLDQHFDLATTRQADRRGI
jgi:hypothetical protein